MNEPAPRPETRASAKPAVERLKPLRAKTVLQRLLERLCMFPSAD